MVCLLLTKKNYFVLSLLKMRFESKYRINRVDREFPASRGCLPSPLVVAVLDKRRNLIDDIAPLLLKRRAQQEQVNPTSDS